MRTPVARIVFTRRATSPPEACACVDTPGTRCRRSRSRSGRRRAERVVVGDEPAPRRRDRAHAARRSRRRARAASRGRPRRSPCRPRARPDRRRSSRRGCAAPRRSRCAGPATSAGRRRPSRRRTVAGVDQRRRRGVRAGVVDDVAEPVVEAAAGAQDDRRAGDGLHVARARLVGVRIGVGAQDLADLGTLAGDGAGEVGDLRRRGDRRARVRPRPCRDPQPPSGTTDRATVMAGSVRRVSTRRTLAENDSRLGGGGLRRGGHVDELESRPLATSSPPMAAVAFAVTRW